MGGKNGHSAALTANIPLWYVAILRTAFASPTTQCKYEWARESVVVDGSSLFMQMHVMKF